MARSNLVRQKVPKCEKFDDAFLTLIDTIWVCDLGTGKKLFILKIKAESENKEHFIPPGLS